MTYAEAEIRKMWNNLILELGYRHAVDGKQKIHLELPKVLR